MQLSEIFRQSIILPKSKIAEMQFSIGQIDEIDMDDYFVIHVNAIFDILWFSGLIGDINELCYTHIDEYEETVVAPRMLSAITALLEGKYLKRREDHLFNFYEQLRDVCLEGVTRDTALYFFL